MADLGSRIKEAAKRVGGLNELARNIDVPRRTLGNWLNGTNPKPEALRAIARVCHVSLDWLLTGDGRPDESYLEAIARRGEQRIVEEEASRERFREKFNAGIDLLAQLSTETDVASEPLTEKARVSPVAGPTHPQELHADLIELLFDKVAEIFSTMGQKAPPRRIAREAALLHNEVVDLVGDVADGDMVEAVLPQVLLRFRRRMEQAAAEPGTGKRSAS